MPVSDEYAARTACKDHARIYTGELRGSRRGSFYSDCEARRSYGCKFSHTIFNSKRILKLGGGSQNFVIELNYGYGFERYGAHEDWRSGWEVTVNGKKLSSGGSHQKTYNLPKSLLLAERKSGLMITETQGESEKIQSLCKSHYERSSCQRPDCRYDHDLIDAKRIEDLGRWSPGGMSADYEILSMECKVTGGRAMWKITLKSEAFAKLSTMSPIAQRLPPRPFSLENEDLLTLVKHVEGVVGVAASNHSIENSFLLTLQTGTLITL